MDYREQAIEAPTIKVVGIGGAGLNAVNAMLAAGLTDVEYIAVSTSQARLRKSHAAVKIRIGSDTRGFGTGGNPETARAAVEVSQQDILNSLTGADLVFLAAGMGSGTGTGATPEIAKLAKEAGALVVAVVTKPFAREGKRRTDIAEQGIKMLLSLVDSLIVIPNDRLIGISGKGTALLEAFKPADDLLRQAVQGIVEIISKHGHINVDLSDLRTILGARGMAMMGTGISSGSDRATAASMMAIHNPLLEGLDIREAKGLLLNIAGSSSMTMDEFDQVCKMMTEQISSDATIIVGVVVDEELADQIKVTVIATGIGSTPAADKPILRLAKGRLM
ncbi:cell division protein FtsZ [Trichlorobacter lovleyi]|uniref:Cell division protein FtsZ n=1 Tax=Trichlorobacter lovleyi (strain ATCC BAA-1151 / DSM 17278 / SZ) TaxID=398767 RepID=B3E8P4_TRIL1|nr:cell division protein FtsZ [Trichlorobacter lovleyi]ACD93747.1 cell division protein FtsZ [Trichlorobacter lovleyi SZ]